MNYPRHIAAVLLAGAAASSAFAQQGTTRAQVEAELAAAQRNGDMLVPGESGLTQRQLRPDLYPSAPVVGKTREQVQAELAAAQRDGDIIANGESGLREKDLDPGLYPADPVVAGKTREQVRAELATAIRDGDMLAPGDSGMTEYQLQPQLYARQRAADEAERLAAQQSASQMGGPAN